MNVLICSGSPYFIGVADNFVFPYPIKYYYNKIIFTKKSGPFIWKCAFAMQFSEMLTAISWE